MQNDRYAAMKLLPLFFLSAVTALSQGQTGAATTTGPCSQANTGNNNIFTINCGIGEALGQKMLDILNKILASQVDAGAVIKKLDEILHVVNPNLPTKTYFCDGHWRTQGPRSLSENPARSKEQKERNRHIMFYAKGLPCLPS